MKTDKMRERVARQTKSHARTIYAKNERLAGAQVHLAENNFKAEPFQQWTREILVTDTRAPGNQNQIGRRNAIQIKLRPCRLKVLRQMFLLQLTRKVLQQAANQNGIAVADLPRLRRLIGRNNFIAGREMRHAQTRTD